MQKMVGYFFREELSKKTRLVNTLFIDIIIAFIPLTILQIAMHHPTNSIILHLFVMVLSVLALFLINNIKNSQVIIIPLLYIVNLILFPVQYFWDGGRNSGMLIWMLFGNIIMWMLLKGAFRIVGIVANYIVIVLCIVVEFIHPSYVTAIGSSDKVCFDIVSAFIIASIIIGDMTINIIKLYENQNQELKDKDKAMMDANKNLESINVSLSQASDAKSNFLANMSHELRTPINAILGMDEMIIRESGDDSIVSYANDIDSAGQQLLSMINDILDFSKLESGKLEIHPAEYELFSIMNDCYNIVYMRARKKELKLIVENNPDLPAILYGDEIRLRQVILNILTNAVKYTPDGYVRISYDFEKIDAENIELIISVKDTGIGISEKEQERLYDPFERADIYNHRDVEGTGVGLAISRRIVDLMEGRINLVSEEGVGSEFTISIPQRIANHGEVVGKFSDRFNQNDMMKKMDNDESDKEKKASSEKVRAKLGDQVVTGAESLKSPDKKKKEAPFHAPEARILIVDDVKMNLNVVRLLLKNTDIQIDLAESGKEGLNYTLMKHYDLILMDHMMPEMDGIETLHKIRDQKMGLNVTTPVVVLTANAIQNVEEMYAKEGFDDYLSKPVRSNELEQTLFKYLPKEKVIYTDMLAAMVKDDGR